jgi:hypothetical protein
VSERQRFILRQMNESAASPSDVASHIEATPGVDVVSRQDPNILVEGEVSVLDRAVGHFPGWRTFPMRTISMPTTRPGVLKPPGSKE